MSPLFFVSCRDCPSYLASAETVRDLLLPTETTVHEKWLPAETVRVFLLPTETTVHEKNGFLQRLSVCFCFLPRLPSTKKMASCRDCPCVSASCRNSRQEAKSHGQSLQEAIYQAKQSRQEAIDRGQFRRKPNMTDSLCRKRKIADSFISREYLD